MSKQEWINNNGAYYQKCYLPHCLRNSVVDHLNNIAKRRINTNGKLKIDLNLKNRNHSLVYINLNSSDS